MVGPVTTATISAAEHAALFRETAQDLWTRARRLVRSAAGLKAMWTYIVAVSLYDIWLVVAVKEVILDTEENPICRALIAWDPHYLSLFIPAKIAGTFLVIAICDRLTRRHRDVAAGVTSGLAGFQSCLLVYLSV